MQEFKIANENYADMKTRLSDKLTKAIFMNKPKASTINSMRSVEEWKKAVLDKQWEDSIIGLENTIFAKFDPRMQEHTQTLLIFRSIERHIKEKEGASFIDLSKALKDIKALESIPLHPQAQKALDIFKEFAKTYEFINKLSGAKGFKSGAGSGALSTTLAGRAQVFLANRLFKNLFFRIPYIGDKDALLHHLRKAVQELKYPRAITLDMLGFKPAHTPSPKSPTNPSGQPFINKQVENAALDFINDERMILDELKDKAEVYTAKNTITPPTNKEMAEAIESDRLIYTSIGDGKVLKEDLKELKGALDSESSPSPSPASEATQSIKKKELDKIDRYAQGAEFKTLSQDKQEAILALKTIEPAPMPNDMIASDLQNLFKHFSNKHDREQREFYSQLFKDTQENPHLVLDVEREGQARKEYIKAYQHKDTHDLYYIAITQDNDKIKITGFPTTDVKEVIREIKKSKGASVIKDSIQAPPLTSQETTKALKVQTDSTTKAPNTQAQSTPIKWQQEGNILRAIVPLQDKQLLLSKDRLGNLYIQSDTKEQIKSYDELKAFNATQAQAEAELENKVLQNLSKHETPQAEATKVGKEVEKEAGEQVSKQAEESKGLKEATQATPAQGKELEAKAEGVDLHTASTAEVKKAFRKKLEPIINQEMQNQEGIKAYFTLKSLDKMLSPKAVQKSIDNGFTREQHLRAVLDIQELYSRAKLATKEAHASQEPNVLINRFNADFENGNALITSKESIDKDKNRLYSLELELTPRFSNTTTPLNSDTSAGSLNSLGDTKGGQNAEPSIVKTDNADSTTKSLNAEARAKPEFEEQYFKNMMSRAKEKLFHKQKISALYKKRQELEKNSKGNKDEIEKINKVLDELSEYGKKEGLQEQYSEKDTIWAILREYKNNKELLDIADEAGQEQNVVLVYLNNAIADMRSNFYLYGAKDKAEYTEARAYYERILGIRPIAEFGTNYAEFFRDGRGGIEKLLAESKDYEARKASGKLTQEEQEAGVYKGQVAGAFYREELGDIDLVWGDSSKGLQHILERRTEDFIKKGMSEKEAQAKAVEFVKGLSEIIENGKLEIKQHRAFIDTPESRALIALDYKGEDKKWIITAYNFDDLNPAEPHSVKLKTDTSSVSRVDAVKTDSTTNPITLQANAHLGAGLISGGVAGVETDENGNIVGFSPEKFAMGFLGGAGGSKMLQSKAAQNYIKKQASSLAADYKALSQNNPMLFATILHKFNPRDLLKGKKEVDKMSQELFNKELGARIEQALHKGEVEAMPKAEFRSREEFSQMFDSINGKYGTITTPIGEVECDISYAWNHFRHNTYKKNRDNLKGGFFETFRNPLFIVEQTREGADKPSVYFYKPFYDEDKKLMNLFGIGFQGDKVEFKTYYLDTNGSRMREVLNNKTKILYIQETL